MTTKSTQNELWRLQSAVMLLAKQQAERAMQGGPDQWAQVTDENIEVMENVLPVIEAALDEDHLDQLDDMDMPMPMPMSMPMMPWGMPKLPKMPFFPDFTDFCFPFTRTRRRRPSRDRGPVRRRDVEQELAEVARPRSALDESVGEFQDDLRAAMRKARRNDRTVSEEELDKLLGRLREELGGVVKGARLSKKSKPDDKD